MTDFYVLHNKLQSNGLGKWPNYACYLGQLRPLFGPIMTSIWPDYNYYYGFSRQLSP